MVIARSPRVGYRKFRGTPKHDIKRIVLAGIEALEVRQESEISYYLSIGNVSYTVFGPTTETAVVRKIAQSLAP